MSGKGKKHDLHHTSAILSSFAVAIAMSGEERGKQALCKLLLIMKNSDFKTVTDRPPIRGVSGVVGDCLSLCLCFRLVTF